MSLFKVNNTERKIKIQDIEFCLFQNTLEQFDLYNSKQNQFYFTNCFEYINKMNLNTRYTMLYLCDMKYIYLYDEKNDELIAYNYDSYLFMKTKYKKKLKVKYVSNDELVNVDYKSTGELVDAIYFPDGLSKMEGKKYLRLRQHRNNFINKTNNVEFIPYSNKHKQQIINLYESWKENAKDTGNTFIVDAKVFKDGLTNDYLEKFVLLADNNIIGFISYYVVNEWCYVYSMKTLRTIRNANVYLVNRCWQDISEKYPNVKYINLGGIDNVEWEDDFKMQLKPDILLYYQANVEIKE